MKTSPENDGLNGFYPLLSEFKELKNLGNAALKLRFSPSGNFFGNWLNIIYFLPVGLLIKIENK